MIDVHVDSAAAQSDLRDLGAGLHQAAALALKAAVKATEESVAATSLYKDRSGKTRASATSEVTDLTGRVFSGGMTRFLEYGTVPHAIVAKRSGVLAFQMNGSTVFRRSVHHPGTEPRPFMDTARALGEQAADYGAEYYANYAIDRYNR